MNQKPNTRNDTPRTSFPAINVRNRGALKDQADSNSNGILVSNTMKTPPYSIFSKSQKMIIVAIASTSAFFSPLSSNIYYPALRIIQEDMDVSSNLINLTITMYMVFQGISPLFWGSVADMVGRRPVFISTFMVYIAACVGLASSKTFAALISLRMLQSFGSSSAIAVGAGTIGDISTPAERGGYMGIFSMGSMLGPLVGPFLGGILTHQLGWRWIFWTLVIMASTVLMAQIFLLPETLRLLVGNGSGYANPTPYQFWKHYMRNTSSSPPPPSSSSPALPSEKKSQNSIKTTTGSGSSISYMSTDDNRTITSTKDVEAIILTKKPKTAMAIVKKMFQTAAYLKEKDVAMILLYSSLDFAALHCILSSMTPLYTRVYGIDEFHIGICFLSPGFGAFVGSYFSGKIMNWRYRYVAKNFGMSEGESLNRSDLDPKFPIEKARLGIVWIYGLIFNVTMIGYGWCLNYNVHIALPIIFTFITSFTATATYNTTNTILVDLFPHNAAAIVATSNLTRCLIAAASILSVLPGADTIGIGWTFTAISSALLVTRLALLVVFACGPKWRLERIDRILQQQPLSP